MKTNHDDKTIFQNPARRHQNIYTDSPHRYITCYNPTKMLTTADKSITNALNETYKMKENVTEESVIDYFEQILDNFDEKESERNPAKSHKITENIISNLNEKANTGKLSINSKSQVHQISVSGSVNKKQKNHINLDRTFQNEPQQSSNERSGSSQHKKSENHSQPHQKQIQKPRQESKIVQKNINSSKGLKTSQGGYKIEIYKTTSDQMSDSKTSMDPVNEKSKLTKERKALVYTTVRGFDSFMMY